MYKASRNQSLRITENPDAGMCRETNEGNIRGDWEAFIPNKLLRTPYRAAQLELLAERFEVRHRRFRGDTFQRAVQVGIEHGVAHDGNPPAGQSVEHLSELREAHLKATAKLVGFGYRRLTTTDALADAVLDPALARDLPTPTDVRWVAVVAALALLVWRFAPPLLRTRRPAAHLDGA